MPSQAAGNRALAIVWGCLVGAFSLACGSEEPAASLPSCVVPIGASPARGPADALVTIVEFADFECSYCGEAQSTIREVDTKRPGLRWVYKHFPLTSIHPHALSAAIAAQCAHEQGAFWAMHDMLFAHQSALGDASLVGYATTIGLDLDAFAICRESSEVMDEIEGDFRLGWDIGVGGTPTFFINGEALPGAYPVEDFTRLIDTAESKAKRSGIAATDYYASIERDGCTLR